MNERWTSAQVLSVAPDASVQKAAHGLATASRWSGSGADPHGVWGLCAGSGKTPYQTCVDLGGPAYKCSCPSRKFPCKHALGLLLLWSAGGVPGGAAPEWVAQWRAARQGRAERVAKPAGTVADPQAALRRARQRSARVSAGLAELDLWLRDQVHRGLAGAERAPYSEWDAVAARLVDAQAGPVASWVRRLAGVPASGPGWPGRLLEEYALLHLLVAGYRGAATLPAPLAATVRARAGLPSAPPEGAPAVRDRWQVIGARTTEEERLTTRRTWLRGRSSGRAALVLSFAGPGQPLDASLVPGTEVDAELAFHDGALPLRAVVAHQHGDASPAAEPPTANVTGLHAEYATALAADPWLAEWPVVLGGVVPVRAGEGWGLADAGGVVALSASSPPWPLLAASGGHPVTVSGEWQPATGFHVLMTWAA